MLEVWLFQPISLGEHLVFDFAFSGIHPETTFPEGGTLHLKPPLSLGYQFLAFTLTDLLALIECYP